jgi:phage/plasmid primase-like uncharacterized protein
MNWNINLSDVINEFCNECQANGLIISPNQIIADGKIHKCPVIESNISKTSGRYFIYATDINKDFPFNGYIRNYPGMVEINWNYLKYLKITKNSNQIHNLQNTDLDVDKKNYNDSHYQKTAYVAYQIFQKGRKYPLGYNYLSKKRIKPFGIVFRDFNGVTDIVTVPGRDESGKIWTIQSIHPDGTKFFLRNGKQKGMFHKLGNTALTHEYQDTIFIAEGYATAASIYMATNMLTICAFSSENLVDVGLVIRKLCKDSKIIFCVDADYAGIANAIKASLNTNGRIICPIFSKLERVNYNDFNDLLCMFNINFVKEQIMEQLETNGMPIEEQAYRLLFNEIEESQIAPQKFISLAETFIEAYHIRQTAKDLILMTAEDQFNLIENRINPKYKEILIDTFTSIEASRIALIGSLNERRASISKIHNRYHEQLLPKIKKIWQKNREKISIMGGSNENE